MKKLSIVVVAMLVLFGFVSSGFAAVEIRIGHSGSERTLLHRAFVVFQDEVQRNSNGEIVATIFPNAQLGGDRELQEAVQMGDLTMTGSSTAPLMAFEPRLGVFTIPFIFPNVEQGYEILDGPFGRKMLDIMADQGFKALGFLESNAYRDLMTRNTRVVTPADLSGIKIRTMQNPMHIALWQAFGANPQAISFAELYTALQQGTVDAMESPLELLVSQRFYEVQGVYVTTRHLFQVGMATMNIDFYYALSDAHRQIVNDAMRTAVLFQRDTAAQEHDQDLQTLRDNNVIIVELTPEQRNAFRDLVDPVIDLVRQEAGSELVDELLSLTR